MGTTWVYDVTYGDEVTTFTVEVTGEETWEGVDCYTTATAYSAPPARNAAGTGTAITISGADSWKSKTTLDDVHTLAAITMFGLELSTFIDRTYTGDHFWELSEGKTWSYLEDIVLDPPMQVVPEAVNDAEVVAFESVTVAAGTFDCSKITYTKVEEGGVPITPVLAKTEWWSPDVVGTVKIIDHATFMEEETQELSSYTPGS